MRSHRAQATWDISRSLAGACGDRAAICAEPVEALRAIAALEADERRKSTVQSCKQHDIIKVLTLKP
jgi:hypothetical protein